jgi:FtsP/CotA-like multicopper oxidase with cupredoxin domain
VGTPVVLALANAAPAPYALHLHGHSARVLHAFDDGWEPYWLDTILVKAGETVHVAFVADNPGRWAIDGVRIGGRLDTATWFEVTA